MGHVLAEGELVRFDAEAVGFDGENAARFNGEKTVEFGEEKAIDFDRAKAVDFEEGMAVEVDGEIAVKFVKKSQSTSTKKHHWAQKTAPWLGATIQSNSLKISTSRGLVR